MLADWQSSYQLDATTSLPAARITILVIDEESGYLGSVLVSPRGLAVHHLPCYLNGCHHCLLEPSRW